MSKAGPILFLATGARATPGGIAAANLNVLAALERLGAESGRAVITFALWEPAGADPAYRGFAGGKARFAIAGVIAALRAGLVVIDHARIADLFVAIPAALRAPSAIFVHGSEASWRIRRASIPTLRKADLVIANSDHTLHRMAEYVRQFRGLTCPLGLSPRMTLTASPKKGPPTALTLTAADGAERALGDRVLLIVSRLDATEREKGHRELIAALPALRARHPGAQLVIAGGGSDLDLLRAEAAASPAAGAIFLPGRIDDARLAALYDLAYAFVMPSRQEGFGLVYLEAMNHALPCLACEDDGGAEVVAGGQTGVLIPHDFTPDDLVAGLDHLLVDPARARRYGEAGWARLMETFTARAYQDRLIQVLRPLLEGRRADA